MSLTMREELQTEYLGFGEKPLSAPRARDSGEIAQLGAC